MRFGLLGIAKKRTELDRGLFDLRVEAHTLRDERGERGDSSDRGELEPRPHDALLLQLRRRFVAQLQRELDGLKCAHDYRGGGLSRPSRHSGRVISPQAGTPRATRRDQDSICACM